MTLAQIAEAALRYRDFNEDAGSPKQKEILACRVSAFVAGIATGAMNNGDIETVQNCQAYLQLMIEQQSGVETN